MGYKKGPRKVGDKAIISQALDVIPEPEPGSATVLVFEVLPGIRGKGKTNLLCGGCGAVLAERIVMGQVQNMVLKCPTCESYNVVPDGRELPRS